MLSKEPKERNPILMYTDKVLWQNQHLPAKCLEEVIKNYDTMLLDVKKMGCEQ